ncbi:MAG: methyl-accepting chemotaxis sensory transducer [Firmicutes bacterium]|nr:methyl-accepting chemotaxis sensory transducer [Bacillota bacterium]
MKIKTKIVSGYIFVSALIFIVTITTLYGLNEIRTHYQQIINNSDTAITTLREIQFYFTGQANDERGFLITGSPEFKKEILEKSEQIKQRINKIEPLMVSSKEKELLTQVADAHSKFTNINIQTIDLYYAGKPQEAQQLSFSVGRKARKDLEVVFNELVKLKEEESANEKTIAEATLNRVKLMTLITSLVMVLFGIGFGMVLARRIVNPITAIIQHMKNGNLNFSDIGASKDEIGALTREFGTMIEGIRQMVLGVRSTAEQVASSAQQLTATAEQTAQASVQISSSITEVASGAEKQSKAFDNTSEAIERISVGIQNVLASTNTANSTTSKTAVAAQEGLEAIATAINQMSSIEKTVNTSAIVVSKLGERSKEIGQIVDTISGIAGQTNLLALNAAIEAARAGENGKGFAVVAEEVRKLAEQSQEAAKQIASLIGEIQLDTSNAVVAMNAGTNEVTKGTEVATSAGKSFDNIANLVAKVSGEFKEVASAIAEIADQSDYIVTEVKVIDDISKNALGHTQMVSAASEEQSASMQEVAASSQSLAKLAEDLQQAIEKFKA